MRLMQTQHHLTRRFHPLLALSYADPPARLVNRFILLGITNVVVHTQSQREEIIIYSRACDMRTSTSLSVVVPLKSLKRDCV